MNSPIKANGVNSLLFGQVSIAEHSANLALLLLRIYAGYTIMMAGLDKLPLPEWMVEQVAGMGFPWPTVFAWIAAFGEFGFGALLCLGLATRPSGLVLAIIMGFASFAFHKASPLVEMHIAQHFFWIFFLFTFLGAGAYSLDRYIYNPATSSLSKLSFVTLALFAVLLTIGLSREFLVQPTVREDSLTISSVNVAGSFNDWNPASNDMVMQGDSTYTLVVDFEKSGLIEFKFTANRTWDIHLGEVDQASVGFPVVGTAERDKGSTTENIRAFVPHPGAYRFTLDLKTYRYSLDSAGTGP